MVQELFEVQHVVASPIWLSVPRYMVDRPNSNYLHQIHRYQLDLVVEILNDDIKRNEKKDGKLAQFNYSN